MGRTKATLNQPIVENNLAYHQKVQAYKRVEGRTKNQGNFIKSIINNAISLGIGQAGSGKTHIAIGAAVHLLETERIDKIIISRPAIPVYEDIGFQPGSKDEKMLHFIQPMLDELEYFLPKTKLKEYMADGTIDVVPLCFMQGRNVRDNQILIVDEIGLLRREQFELILTRICPHGKIVMMGDPRQSGGHDTPLADIARRLEHLEDVGVVYFSASDNQRHSLVKDIEIILNQSLPTPYLVSNNDWRFYNEEYDADFGDE